MVDSSPFTLMTDIFVIEFANLMKHLGKTPLCQFEMLGGTYAQNMITIAIIYAHSK